MFADSKEFGRVLRIGCGFSKQNVNYILQGEPLNEEDTAFVNLLYSKHKEKDTPVIYYSKINALNYRITQILKSPA